MTTEQVEAKRPDEHGHVERIAISVNFKPVTLEHRRVTGLQIKQAAIAQGVNIQADFVLFLDHGHGRRDPVRDDQEIEVHDGEKFEAVPGDDNS